MCARVREATFFQPYEKVELILVAQNASKCIIKSLKKNKPLYGYFQKNNKPDEYKSQCGEWTKDAKNSDS